MNSTFEWKPKVFVQAHAAPNVNILLKIRKSGVTFSDTYNYLIRTDHFKEKFKKYISSDFELYDLFRTNFEKYVENNFENYLLISHLNLTKMNIKTIPNTITNFKSLQILNLNYNIMLKEIKYSSFFFEQNYNP